MCHEVLVITPGKGTQTTTMTHVVNGVTGMQMSHFKPSLEAYLAQPGRQELFGSSKRLLDKARTAAAWAVPDHESTGYSQSELASIIYQLINHIERIELCLKHKQSNK